MGDGIGGVVADGSADGPSSFCFSFGTTPQKKGIARGKEVYLGLRFKGIIGIEWILHRVGIHIVRS